MVLPYRIGGLMDKKCSKCSKIKDISMFYRNKYRTDGRQSHCKVCHDETTTKWRKNNPDKYSKYNCSPRRNEEMKHKSKMRSRKHRHDLSDRYVRDLMTMHTDLKPDDVPSEFVKAYKINLKLKRKLKITRKLKHI